MPAPEHLRRPAEGRVPSLYGATGWLNSNPLGAADLRGRVVVFDFCTYSCINWLRSLPHVRAWSERYADRGLVVIGVHSPEFSFERDVEGVAAFLRRRHVDYPVAIDNDFAIWTAFANRCWPATYIADAEGVIRHHRFGEGDYEQSERVIEGLLESGGTGRYPASVQVRGDEAPADWRRLRSPETYLGYVRMQSFASPEGESVYAFPQTLRVNHWALSGVWRIGSESAVLDEPGGRIAYRFHARDLHLVMGSHTPVPFRISLDARPPGAANGLDVDEDGYGVVVEPRLYQLVRQRGSVEDRTFEIAFHDGGVEAFVFTFG